MPSNLLLDPGRQRLRAWPKSLALSARPARMALSRLWVTLEEHEDLLLVAAKGNLDIYTVPDFAERVDHLDPTKIQLVVDLSRVRLLDSAGLSALVSLRNRAHRAGARLGLICPRPLARLFWLAGLGAAFAVGDTLSAVRVALAGACDEVGAAPALTR